MEFGKKEIKKNLRENKTDFILGPSKYFFIISFIILIN